MSGKFGIMLFFQESELDPYKDLYAAQARNRKLHAKVKRLQAELDEMKQDQATVSKGTFYGRT